MPVNSINTNIAAYFAQQNIGNASAATALNVARLSSGNRIIRAADDVAALAIGTALGIGVSVFKTALLNAAQGNSLLQVADGGLSQISEILKRQKTIAAQAGSGSLSDTERAYLNQEFQALTDEIDRIASETTFSGVNLIDGSISGSTQFYTNDNDGTSTSLQTPATGFLTIHSGGSLPSSGDTITVAGVTLTFTTAEQGSTAANGKIVIGPNANSTALNIAAALNEAAATDGRLANLFFETSANVVLANWTGGDGAGTVSVTVSSSFSTNVNTSANIAIGISSGTNGLGVDRTSYVGEITGSIFVQGGTTAASIGQALNLSNVEDNADFIGKFGEGNVGLITGTYANVAENASFSLVVGGITYATTAADIITASNVTTLTFNGTDEFGAAAGGSFVIKLNGDNLTTFDSQAELNDLVKQINDGLSNVVIQQNRDLLGVANVGSVLSDGVEVANTTGMQFDLRIDDFSKTTISDFTITAPSAGGTDAVFEVYINGELYRSVAGIGNQIGKNTVIALQNVNDSSKVFTITTGNTGIQDASSTTLDLSNQTKATAVQEAIKLALGVADGGLGLQFQVGADANSNLNVTIGDASTATLFGGLSLNVSTQQDAENAAEQLDLAVTTVTNLRAGVGALQSRFGFASANLQVAIQNQEAARAELLDTDIATESTIYATNQVKIQAGIATLAQSNQQLQSLLKLIG